jgi:hypothetical protein
MIVNKKIIALTIVLIIFLSTSPLSLAEIELKKPINLRDEKEYRALLIGINDYPGSTIDLPYSVNEIMSLKKTLIDGGNWEESNILILTDEMGNKTGIYQGIEWLETNADENDISLIYYAGHGGISPTNEFLVVYNGTISDLELDQKIDNLSGKIIVVLDSCHSGGFIEELGEKDRTIITACRKDNLTFQYSKLKSGIFGYFFNLSLEKYTKSIETTFIFTYFTTVYYTKKLSEEFGEDYRIYPQMYDRNFGRTKIINKHNFTSTFIYEALKTPIRDRIQNIWKM